MSPVYLPRLVSPLPFLSIQHLILLLLPLHLSSLIVGIVWKFQMASSLPQSPLPPHYFFICPFCSIFSLPFPSTGSFSPFLTYLLSLVVDIVVLALMDHPQISASSPHSLSSVPLPFHSLFLHNHRLPNLSLSPSLTVAVEIPFLSSALS